ncbi:MAG: radical SAM family heme chaperone HemW [Candidatus Gastranaerophilales bacterium]|nr:radical SAM family heme chaperone HemW [Candidatus Gastranaerophilales bacterium]
MINCVYIHIPFCEKKCNYCAFCSYSALGAKEKYLNALKKEIKFHYKNEILKTIYFGGGTPSLLESEEIKEILSLLNYNSNTQITIECNPNSLNNKKIDEYKNLGINRFSIGIQSFNDEELRLLGRLHNTQKIYETIDLLEENNIENYSIDLMYGIPNQNIKNWENNLDKAIILRPKHISLYGLKIEEGTYFYKYPPKNIATLDEQADMYELAIEKLKKNYIHYEFSNFATSEKYFSKHNLAYWNREEYYGFGLSASGFINNKRYTNTFNFSQYIKNPTEKEYEILTIKNAIEEEIFLGLRLIEGINFNLINTKYDIDIIKKYGNIFEKYISNKLMEKTEKGVRLTQKGILLSNEILCEFIDV